MVHSGLAGMHYIDTGLVVNNNGNATKFYIRSIAAVLTISQICYCYTIQVVKNKSMKNQNL